MLSVDADDEEFDDDDDDDTLLVTARVAQKCNIETTTVVCRWSSTLVIESANVKSHFSILFKQNSPQNNTFLAS